MTGRERDPHDEPPRPEHVDTALEDDPDREGDHEEQDEVLVEQPDAGDAADGDPEARVGALEDPCDQPEHEHPCEQVERGGAQDVGHREDDGSEGRAHRREDACPRRSTEVLRERCDHQDHDHPGEHGRHSQRAWRRAERRLRQSSEQRGERRLVDVTPCEVMAGLDEVQLGSRWKP